MGNVLQLRKTNLSGMCYAFLRPPTIRKKKMKTFTPKDTYLCDNCFEMDADYGIEGIDGTPVYICSACTEEATFYNIKLEGHN